MNAIVVVEKQKRPVGRPSDYDPDYCVQVIEYGKLGKSRTWIAAALDITRKTLATWEHEHPEFLVAMERAGVFSQMWWEDAGQSGMREDKFSAPVWSRSMAARFPDEWRETSTVKQETETKLLIEASDMAMLLLSKLRPVIEGDFEEALLEKSENDD